MTFNIVTLGCKVNQYESQLMFEYMVDAGFAPDTTAPDITIINSCTVTHTSDSKNRKVINRTRRENKDAIIVLTGCMPQAFKDDTELFINCDIVLGNVCRKELVPAIKEFMVNKKRIIKIADHEKGEKFEEMRVNKFLERTRAFVKIEDGCNRFCSYCIIPYARGRVRSKSLEDLRAEVETLAIKGYNEIVLVGINLSAYGDDINSSLADAVETVCSIDGVERVRLSSLEPELMTEDVLKRLAAQEKFCPHFHLSLQSGCDETLKRMHRHYTSAEYAQIVRSIRDIFTNPSITTDVMVGFAGETDEEFQKNLDFTDIIGFAKVHVFSYSRRKGTLADKMPDQVDPNTKNIRSKLMIEHTDKKRMEFLSSQVGLTEEVLFELKNRLGFYEGYTKNYTPVYLKSDIDVVGKILKVKLIDAKDDYCIGVIE
ncbi:MAG: tRNA (N(6)-L-threonylcarbamoyladenosine(37)-C(2))-methylthiotransferase MtaB [Eubacteriales bacterium]|nr:tRNA (N(6)-L-threonylcarbamoyladenosine(37)-C(2))-methylthiotransferase MtaB [Eubacteriales bacterium]